MLSLFSVARTGAFIIMGELYTVKELAQYLKFNPTTIVRMASRGEIPAIKVGRQLRFDKNQIDRWLRTRTTGKPLDILVADDDEVIIKLFCASLKDPLYHLTTVSNGQEALQRLQTASFDLVFLDLSMPVMDGAEVFGRLRRSDKQTPVAIMTGYPDSELFKQAMEFGPFLVINKPFNTADIITAVNSYLGNASLQETIMSKL